MQTDQAAGRHPAAEPDLLPYRLAGLPGGSGCARSMPGNYVQTSDANGIVVLTQIAADLGDLHPAGGQSAGGAEAGACRRDPAGRRLRPQRRDTSSIPGSSTTIDNQIDTTTGTVKLRAIFDNPTQNLFPNQFVNIQLLGRHAAQGRDRARGGDPARRAGHVRLSRQARPDGDGAAGEARPERRPAGRVLTGSQPARASSSTAPTGSRTAPRSTHRPGSGARRRRAGAAKAGAADTRRGKRRPASAQARRRRTGAAASEQARRRETSGAGERSDRRRQHHEPVAARSSCGRSRPRC